MTRIPGLFVPLYVNYPRDAAIRRAGPDAELLFIRALVFAKGSGTDGFIPDYDLEAAAVGLRSVPRSVAALVNHNLWEVVEGGWQIRTYDKWNVTSDQVAETRGAKQTAGIKGNHERWHVQTGKADPTCPLCQTIAPGSHLRSQPDRICDSQADRKTSLEVEVEGEVYKDSSSVTADAAPDKPKREDVEHICNHLANRIQANGSKRPTITKTWQDAARLLIDKDERTVEQIVWIIDWATQDEFWRTNILSMPKLREKFDQLRLKATGTTTGPPKPVVIDQWRTR